MLDKNCWFPTEEAGLFIGDSATALKTEGEGVRFTLDPVLGFEFQNFPWTDWKAGWLRLNEAHTTTPLSLSPPYCLADGFLSWDVIDCVNNSTITSFIPVKTWTLQKTFSWRVSFDFKSETGLSNLMRCSETLTCGVLARSYCSWRFKVSSQLRFTTNRTQMYFHVWCIYLY